MNGREIQLYRSFRAAIVLESKEYTDWKNSLGLSETARNDLQAGRKFVTAFRETVLHEFDELMQTRRATEALVRKALGIPISIPLYASMWDGCINILYRLASTDISIRRAARLLRQVRTHEGRHFVFARFIDGTLPWRKDFFSPSTSLLLRYFTHSTADSESERVHNTNVNTLKALHRVGVSDTQTLWEHVQTLPETVEPVLLRILVEEKIIESSSQLSYFRDSKKNFHRRSIEDSSVANFKLVVRALKQHNVAIEDILQLAQVEHHREPSKFAETVKLLNKAGIHDIGKVFRHVGEVLWTGELSSWDFVLNDLRVLSAEDLGLFKDILVQSGTPASELGTYLRSKRLRPAELAAFGRIFSLVARGQSSDSIARFQVLCDAPNMLPPVDLVACERYLRNRQVGDVKQFLVCLHVHGYVNPQAILEFQPCFANLSFERFDMLLGIFRSRKNGDSASGAANWLQEYGRRFNVTNYSDAVLEYLVSAIPLPTATSLFDILPACRMELPVIEYVVRSIGLSTGKDVLEWVKKNGCHFKAYQRFEDRDEVLKLLMDDAKSRNNFAFVNRNYARFVIELDGLAREKLGAFKPAKNRAESEAISESLRRLKNELKGPLLECVRLVLARNGGLLLPSLLAIAFRVPTQLTDAIDCLTPLIDEVMMGRGPSHATLTDLEADALETIYGFSLSQLPVAWDEVAGMEHHVQAWCQNPSVTMRLKTVSYKTDKTLDSYGVEALRNARDFALRFEPKRFQDQDMFVACKNLSPKQLMVKQDGTDGANVITLHRHFGVLLAVARGYPVVDTWLNEKIDELMALEAGGGNSRQLLNELNAFLAPGVQDGLRACVDGFLARFSQKDISDLLFRFSGRQIEPDEQIDFREIAKSEILKSVELIIPKYTRWVSRELSKFEKSDAGTASIAKLAASVSKYPAAFFTKSLTDLCTDDNVKMWAEPRHAHLVVFDPARKKFVGMAMVYRESFPALAGGKPSLIIRGINLTSEALEEYDLTSIVEGFFHAATEIALKSGLACVAIPSGTSQHYLSNHDVIQEEIEDRFLAAARQGRSELVQMVDLDRKPNYSSRRFGRSEENTRFYAYEKGSGAVSTLFIIWKNPKLARANAETTQNATVG
jgi:hypothetical protein